MIIFNKFSKTTDKNIDERAMTKMRVIKLFLTMLFTSLLVNSVFAKSFLTYDEFKSLETDQKVKILDQIRSIVVDIEFKYKKNPKLKKSTYHLNILKLWNQIVANAYANDAIDIAKVNGVKGNELCMFAGWPSILYYDANRGYNVCMHPGMIQYNASLTADQKKLGTNYTTAQQSVKTQCNAYQGIVCNPTLFGKIDYCALGKNIDENQNSSLDCWRVAKEHKTDDTLVKSLTEDNKLSEDFHNIFKMVYGMCLCNGTYKDSNGKRKRFVGESYAKYAMGHRTCAGLLNQTRALTEKLSLNCSQISSPSIENVSDFLSSVNDTVDHYLTNILYKGAGNSQEYYENLLTGSTSRTNIETAKRAERIEASKTLEDDLYCGKDFYEKKENLHPTLVITPNDLGTTYTFEIKIDFTSSTNKNESDYEIIAVTNPTTREDKIENGTYTYTKAENEISVKFHLKYKDGNVVYESELYNIPAIKKDNKLKIELAISKENNELIVYTHKILLEGTDITQEKTKYSLEVTDEANVKIENLEISENNITYNKREELFTVKYKLYDEAKNLADEVPVKIKAKEKTEDEQNKIEVVIVADSDKEETVRYKHTITIENTDVTSQTDKYVLTIKNSSTQQDITDKIKIDDSTFEFKKLDTEYNVIYTAINKADNKEIGTKEITINKKDLIVDKYKLGIKEVEEDKKYTIAAQLFDSTDAELKTPLGQIPDGYSIEWYKGDELQTEKNFDEFTRDRLSEDYTLTAKLKNGDKEVETKDVTIKKLENTDIDDDGDDFSIEIKTPVLTDGTYKIDATLTVAGEAVDKIPEGYTVKWVVTSGKVSDSEDLLDELDNTTTGDETQTASGTLTIDVKQSELNKTAAVTVTKDDKEKSDSEVLEGTGIDIEDDDTDDIDRTIGSNANPYQQRTTPPAGVPKPKMILRGKDGHQGRWGY